MGVGDRFSWTDCRQLQGKARVRWEKAAESNGRAVWEMGSRCGRELIYVVGSEEKTGVWSEAVEVGEKFE